MEEKKMNAAPLLAVVAPKAMQTIQKVLESRKKFSTEEQILLMVGVIAENTTELKEVNNKLAEQLQIANQKLDVLLSR